MDVAVVDEVGELSCENFVFDLFADGVEHFSDVCVLLRAHLEIVYSEFGCHPFSLICSHFSIFAVYLVAHQYFDYILSCVGFDLL